MKTPEKIALAASIVVATSLASQVTAPSVSFADEVASDCIEESIDLDVQVGDAISTDTPIQGVEKYSHDEGALVPTGDSEVSGFGGVEENVSCDSSDDVNADTLDGVESNDDDSPPWGRFLL